MACSLTVDVGETEFHKMEVPAPTPRHRFDLFMSVGMVHFGTEDTRWGEFEKVALPLKKMS